MMVPLSRGWNPPHSVGAGVRLVNGNRAVS
jgi:hypothetical protein